MNFGLSSSGEGAFLDHLLVAALDGAIPLAQVDDVALVVAQDLELDVVRVLDELLDVDPGVAEGLLRLAARGVIAFDQRNVVVGHAHPAPAAAGDGLDHDRVADPLGHRQRVLLVLHHAVRAGRRGHAGLLGQRPADRLVLQRVHGARVRADEPDVAALADVGEVGVLGQETVAGVDGIHVGDLGRADDPVNAQIALAGGRFADADGLVRQLHVHRVGVRLRIDRHRADVQFLAGADDADGNLAAIGDQNFLEHAWRR